MPTGKAVAINNGEISDAKGASNMNTSIHGQPSGRRATAAFTLPEVLVSVAIVATMFLSLYAGITSGFAVVSVARENLRATQIMAEKMETMRLYSWLQINSNGFIPTSFTTQMFPSTAATTLAASSSSGSTGEALTNSGSGVTFYGTVALTPVDISAGYSNYMRLVTITLVWTNGNVARTREMQTFVSANGLQQYIYH